MSKKVLILGKGYLGKEFERHGFEVWGRDKFNIDPKYDDLQWDLLKEYDVIVNCIGKSNTRWCEDNNNFDEATFINGKLPGIFSQFCKENNMKFVQISTGCLYDDTTKANTEDSFLAAHCNYTVTKWIGELGCDKERDLILRPRLYFSDVKDRNNLLCKLPKFESHTYDQLDSLTSTSTIVGATKELINAEQSGIFNVAQIGAASIWDVAKWCNLPGGTLTAEQLRNQEGLYLVNNVMDVTKLLKFYTPLKIEDAIKLSYKELA